MSEPFVGQIISVGFNFPPLGWLPCDGSLRPISEYETLYALLGTTYGGDGISTFGLPDLRSRTPLCMGQGTGLSNYIQGQLVGTEQVTLTGANMPSHNHPVSLSANDATTITPVGGSTVGNNVQPALNGFYAKGPVNQPLSSSSFTASTGGLPHENRQPFLALNYVIAWTGVYPSQS
jgi:microcystin-dependent protein